MKLFIFLSILTPENPKSRLTFPLNPDFEYLFIPQINPQIGLTKVMKRNYIFIYFSFYFYSRKSKKQTHVSVGSRLRILIYSPNKSPDWAYQSYEKKLYIHLFLFLFLFPKIQKVDSCFGGSVEFSYLIYSFKCRLFRKQIKVILIYNINALHFRSTEI